MKRFKAVSILLTVLMVMSVFAPYSSVYADPARTVTSIEIVSTEGFTLPLDDPDYYYLESHEYDAENERGDKLVVKFSDGTTDVYPCINEAWSFEKDGKRIEVMLDEWVDEPDEFVVGQSYEVSLFVYSAPTESGIIDHPYLVPISVTIVDDAPSVFIDSIQLTLKDDSILQLTETEDGLYNPDHILCREGDELFVSYSDGTEENLVADEDGDFYSEEYDEWIFVYFQWASADGVEIDDYGKLKGTTGETYNANAFTYKQFGGTHSSGDEIFDLDEEGKCTAFPVKIAGYEWEIDYEWTDDNSSVTATATRKDDPDITRTETVNASAKITKSPTDTEMGETTYTAVFTKNPFVTQEKTVANIPLRDLIVAGGEEGTDYTYTGGVLTFLKNGTYSVRMRNGVSETSDRIVVDAKGTTSTEDHFVDSEFSEIDLTLDGVSISTTGATHALFMDSRYRESCFDFQLHLKGKNTLASDKSPWYSGGRMLWDLTVDAFDAAGEDSLELVDRGKGQIDLSNFTLNSGKFELKSGEFNVDKVITINDGEFVVDSTDDAGAVYCNQAFIMNGGKVDVTNSGSRCIHVTGTQADAVDGVVINGGDLTLTSKHTMDGAAITTGERNRKNIIINTDGTVTINTNHRGIYTFNGGDVIMKKGCLKINGGHAGIVLTGDGGKLIIEGGETEIQSDQAIRLSNADKAINFAEEYVHKNYDGESKEGRVEASDEALLSNGISKQYVLITPAYPITYDLGGGSLGQDTANPEVYSRVDSFTLNNPTKEGSDFSGWTGTGLEDPTESVRIEEGSTGERSYAATYTLHKHTVTWKNYDGNVLETDQNVDYGTLPVYDGETPERAEDDTYVYRFSGWDPEVDTVKGDTEYTAVFRPIKKLEATVTFRVVNGNWNDGKNDEISIVFRAIEGILMELKASDIPGVGTAPAKGFVNGNWDQEPRAQALRDGDAIEFTYTYAPEKYSIAFFDEDGTSVLKPAKEYTFGTSKTEIEVPENPSKEEDAVYTYVFDGWDPELSDVAESVNYKAVYKPVEKEVTIRYSVPANGGSVYPQYETVKVSSGIPQGCTASAADGYDFVKWTDEAGKEVSTSPHFVPEKDESGQYATGYVAVFEKSSSGSGGSGGGGQVEPPAVELSDHIAYINGYPDGTVKPNGKVTRAETSTIIWRLMTDEERDQILTAENDFEDLTEDLWYNKAVSSMIKGGYIAGYPDNTFKGTNQITRAEFVTIMSRIMKVSGGNCDFTDVQGHWAEDAIAAASKEGWVKGYEDGTFRPDDPMTRAEVMAVMNRIRERGVNEKSNLGVYSSVKTFVDNMDPKAWYYYEILEATNDHRTAGQRPDENWEENKTNIVYDKDKYETPGK